MLQVVVSQTELRRLVAAQVREEASEPRTRSSSTGLRLRLPQVEREAALVAVEALEEERVSVGLERRDNGPRRRGRLVLDLDDLGTEIGELHRPPRPGSELLERQTRTSSSGLTPHPFRRPGPAHDPFRELARCLVDHRGSDYGDARSAVAQLRACRGFVGPGRAPHRWARTPRSRLDLVGVDDPFPLKPEQAGASGRLAKAFLVCEGGVRPVDWLQAEGVGSGGDPRARVVPLVARVPGSSSPMKRCGTPSEAA